MKPNKPASYYVDRLSVFADSAEIGDFYARAVGLSAANGEYDYWAAETQEHILGLWLFARECVDKIKEMEGDGRYEPQNGA
jgi:hypothetical protein